MKGITKNHILLLCLLYYNFLIFANVKRSENNRSKSKFTKFKPYETALRGENGQTCNEQHIRKTRSLILSPAYQDLNGNAIKVYDAMKLISRGEKQFQFSASIGASYLGLGKSGEKSVRKAIKELKEHGFIYCAKFSNGAGHIPNTYEFIADWIKWKKPQI